MASPYAMKTIFVIVHVLTGLLLGFERGVHSCEINKKHDIMGKIVGVFEENSRVGKEMKIAAEMAVNDFYVSMACNFEVALVTTNSSDSLDQITSSAVDLMNNKQVMAVIGTIQPSLSAKLTRRVPIISILPTATSAVSYPQLLHFSTPLGAPTQCIADIVRHFRWRRVTVIHGTSSDSPQLVDQLADSLDRVNSAVESSMGINRVDSVDTKLKRLRSKKNRVFVVLRVSLEISKALFRKAKELGMMEKGFVWIVSDDVLNIIDSVESQFVAANMQGVIGFKTDYTDDSESFKSFKQRFRKRYGHEYPEEEEYSNPSLFAIRTYDATTFIAKAIKKLSRMNNSRELLEIILSGNLKGLSGNINFKNGELSNSITFRIINIVGKSYREIAFWSPSSGFSEDGEGNKSLVKGPLSELGTIYWPGGLQKVPNGLFLSSQENPLKVGVPARGAFNQFIKVSYVDNKNETSVSGFSVDVFAAVVRQLPYQLHYRLVPFYGNYDEMINAVSNKTLDAGLGDTEILAQRYEHAEFSQPYLESGLVMVVPLTQDKTKELWMFMKAFKLEMWLIIPAMHLVTSFLVWFIESKENNPDFSGPISQQLPDVLWFSFSLVFFAQRQSIRSNLSRIALATWVFVIIIVAACFTAVLTSMITVSRLDPSVINVEYLKRINAVVGCNTNSFICKYLVNVLHFKPENIKEISSVHGYPIAFESREIAAAFFVKPHAKVFLSIYCKSYTTAGPSFILGGFGIVFPRGSPLVTDVSEAILKVTQSGQIQAMEKQMLFSSICNSSAVPTDPPSLGPWPFSGLFIISGGISTIVFFIKVMNLLEMNLPSPLEILNWAMNLPSPREILNWATFFISSLHVKRESGNSSSQTNTEQSGPNIELPSNQNSVIA